MNYLTVGELAAMYRLPMWKIRLAVDALGEEIPRVGLYRVVPRALLTQLTDELRRRGWLEEKAEPQPA